MKKQAILQTITENRHKMEWWCGRNITFWDKNPKANKNAKKEDEKKGGKQGKKDKQGKLNIDPSRHTAPKENVSNHKKNPHRSHEDAGECGTMNGKGQEPDPPISVPRAALMQIVDRKMSKQMQEDLARRSLLEDQIISLIGGKTGMQTVWHEIESAAANGDINGFLFYSPAFPQKAKRLKTYCDEMGLIVTNETYVQLAEKNEDARLLVLPFLYEENCNQLLQNSKYLEESGMIGKKELTIEELTEWHNQLLREQKRKEL